MNLQVFPTVLRSNDIHRFEEKSKTHIDNGIHHLTWKKSGVEVIYLFQDTNLLNQNTDRLRTI